MAERSAASPASAAAGGPVTPNLAVNLDVAGRRCLVVGAGPVAARKVRSLLECGAAVTVIALEVSPELEALEHDGVERIERRAYAPGDVDGFRLVFAATGDPAVDGAVHADAESLGIWVNSADDGAHCTFTLPAVHRDGAVSVAVSTSGVSPALASWLRARLGAQLDGTGELATLVGQARARLKAAGVSTESVAWGELLDGPLPDLVRRGREREARAVLDRFVADALG